MSATRPEADSEYSRASSPDPGHSRRPAASLRAVVPAVGLAGSVALAVAEFAPLLAVHSSSSAHVIRTVSGGSHHSYALLPLAVLAALLVMIARRSPGSRRAALAGLGVLGLVALAVALLIDLPDATASGLIAGGGSGLAFAGATPRAGFYLETLGAVLLLLGSGAGLIAGASAL